MAASESDVIAGKGTKIRLKSGALVPLHYDFWSLKLIEDEWGSLAGASEMLEAIEKTAERTAFYTVLSKMVPFGLVDLLAAEGNPLPEPEELRVHVLPLLDTRLMSDYLTAAMTAFSESLPSAPEGEARGNGKTPRRRPTPASRGASTTSRQPSTSDAVTASSGA